MVERYRKAGIEGQALQTVSALTLGLKQDLDRDLRQHFQRAGAAHILAVSGLHTGIVYTIFIMLLTLCGHFRPMLDNQTHRFLLCFAVIATMWAYALLTGMSAPVVRSVIMVTIYEIGKLLRRPAASLNTLIAAAIVILLARPAEFLSVGFWLSFSAVAAILIMMPRLPFRNKILRGVSSLLLVSLIAQLGTLPITLHVFGQMSNYFLLANCIVIPLAYAILILGLGLQLFAWLPGVNTLLATLLSGAASLLNHAVAWIESLPGAVTTLSITSPMMVLLFVAIVMGVLSIRHSLYWLIGVFTSIVCWCYLYFLTTL